MYVAQERRAFILRLLQQRGSIRSSALAQELHVTDETIRTDLVALQKRGLLRRTHGGARYVLPTPDISAEDADLRPDCRLADAVASYIKPGKKIFLDNDTMALVVASRLASVPCTFICASARLISKLMAAALPHKIMCPGGVMDKESGLMDSPEARHMLREWQPDVALLFPSAVHPQQVGYTNASRAAWAALAAECSRQTMVIAPADALLHDAPHHVELHPELIITEDNVPEEFAHSPMETVPYISEEDVIQTPGFDY